MSKTQKFCPHCGNTLAPDDKFCGVCGHPVSGGTKPDQGTVPFAAASGSGLADSRSGWITLLVWLHRAYGVFLALVGLWFAVHSGILPYLIVVVDYQRIPELLYDMPLPFEEMVFESFFVWPLVILAAAGVWISIAIGCQKPKARLGGIVFSILLCIMGFYFWLRKQVFDFQEIPYSFVPTGIPFYLFTLWLWFKREVRHWFHRR